MGGRRRSTWLRGRVRVGVRVRVRVRVRVNVRGTVRVNVRVRVRVRRRSTWSLVRRTMTCFLSSASSCGRLVAPLNLL